MIESYRQFFESLGPEGHLGIKAVIVGFVLAGIVVRAIQRKRR